MTSGKMLGVDDGVFYLGRPGFLSDDRLGRLRDEAEAARPGARRFRKEFYAGVGPSGRAFSMSSELRELVAERAADAVPTESASYLYYDEPGSELAPHVDTETFTLNVLMNLVHEHDRERTSAFLLFPDGPAPHRVFLKPGTLILFHAGAVVHARSATSAAGERVWNIGIGFAPVRPLDGTRFWRPSRRAGQSRVKQVSPG
jgi:hypothetical protein